MSLDWDISRVKNNAAIKVGDQRRVTECIIWGTVLFDIGEITEKNIDEWLWRMAFAARCGEHYWYNGKDRRGKPKPWYPTRKDLELRIGLTTNASTRTRRQWIAKLVSIMSSDVTRSLQQQAEDEKKVRAGFSLKEEEQ